MKTQLKTLAMATALVVGLATSSIIYAQESESANGSTMDQGTMGSGMMGQDGMMGGGGMMGMMTMMGQMNQMMATCNNMMQAMMPDSQGAPQEPGAAPENDG